MAVAEASAGDNIALVPPDRLEEVLLSIRHLLHPTSMKPSHCDLISCCDLASTVAGLVTQVSLTTCTLAQKRPYRTSDVHHNGQRHVALILPSLV